MKNFFTAVIAWIKAHIWQTIVIGVAAVGAISTAIVLPIALNNEAPQNSDVEENPNPGPTPVTTFYRINVSVIGSDYGEVKIMVGTDEKRSGTQVLEGTSVTLLFNTTNDSCYLSSLLLNGSEPTGLGVLGEPYTFTASSAIAVNLEINFDVEFAC